MAVRPVVAPSIPTTTRDTNNFNPAGGYTTHTHWIDHRTNRLSGEELDCLVVELGFDNKMRQRWGFRWCSGWAGGGLEVGALDCAQGDPDCNAANHNWASHRRSGDQYKIATDPPGGGGWRNWNWAAENHLVPYIPRILSANSYCTYYNGQPQCA